MAPRNSSESVISSFDTIKITWGSDVIRDISPSEESETNVAAEIKRLNPYITDLYIPSIYEELYGTNE